MVLDRMYRRVPWFTPSDPIILEFLAVGDTRIVQSPSCIARNVPYAVGTVRERLPVLVEHDLIEKTERGYYRLTDTGAALMAGEIEPEDLVEDEENTELGDYAESDDEE